MTRAVHVHVRLQRVRASDMHIALRLAIDIGAPSLPRFLPVSAGRRGEHGLGVQGPDGRGRRCGFNLLLLNLNDL